MISKPELIVPPRANPAESESFPEMMSSSLQMLEQGDTLEAWQAFADGALEAVPHAFETYMSHNCFDLI